MPQQPEDDTWVAAVAERQDRFENPWRDRRQERWQRAREEAEANFERTIDQYGTQMASAASRARAECAGRQAEDKAMFLAEVAAAYARSEVAAKPLRFDGPTGVRMVDGRPVQAHDVSGSAHFVLGGLSRRAGRPGVNGRWWGQWGSWRVGREAVSGRPSSGREAVPSVRGGPDQVAQECWPRGGALGKGVARA